MTAADLIASVKTLADEDLEGLAGFTAIGPVTAAFVEEVARVRASRAAIRLERAEYGANHDASWYNSRQTEEQFLAETGEVQCDCLGGSYGTPHGRDAYGCYNAKDAD